MRNKQRLIAAIAVCVLVGVFIAFRLLHGTLTASTIHIVEKSEDPSGDERWIQAYDPNNQEKEQAFRIMVKDRTAWNLLKVGSEYFASYERRSDNDVYKLREAEPDAVRDSSDGTLPTADNGTVAIKSPMTISNTPIPGTNSTLKLRLVEGSYSEDWQPGAYQGTVYEGEFVFEVQDEVGNTIQTTALNQFYKEPLTFTHLFLLSLDDYNGDGLLDFTLGQHGNSNGNEYRIFSVQRDFSIVELPVPGSSLYVSGGTGDKYSIKLEAEEGGILHYSYYSQEEGNYVQKKLGWKDGAFADMK